MKHCVYCDGKAEGIIDNTAICGDKQCVDTHIVNHPESVSVNIEPSAPIAVKCCGYNHFDTCPRCGR